MTANNKPPAAMSSRLATMKFMQRAATSPTSSPNTTPDHRSAKRQRLSNGSFQSSPTATPGSDAEAIQQALAAEERKRQEAVDREAANRGETKWVLDIKSPPRANTSRFRVVSTGYAALDNTAAEHDESDEVETPQSGRRKFGTFPVKTTTPKQADSDAEPDEGTEDEADDDPDPKTPGSVPKGFGDALRAKRDAKRRKERSHASQQAGDRRSRQVSLNRPTSISNGGKARSSGPITCHRCGQAGHIQAKCPLQRK